VNTVIDRFINYRLICEYTNASHDNARVSTAVTSLRNEVLFVTMEKRDYLITKQARAILSKLYSYIGTRPYHRLRQQM